MERYVPVNSYLAIENILYPELGWDNIDELTNLIKYHVSEDIAKNYIIVLAVIK